MEEPTMRVRRCWQVAVAVVVSLVPVLAIPAEAQVAGLITKYARISRDYRVPLGDTTIFNSVTLRSRGYIQDACLDLDVDCLARSGRYRPEATAQAKVIQELNGRRLAVLADSGGPVQWEVARSPDSECAPEVPWGVDGNIDPPDLPPGYTRCNWRIDVVVDDGNGKPGMIEVRRWSSGAPDDLEALLANRRLQVRAYDSRLTFERSNELNASRWLRSYQGRGIDWCVWADRGGVTGAVYFAELENAPSDIREECDQDDKDRQPVKRNPPSIEPAMQKAEDDVGCVGHWQVGVERLASSSRRIVVDFGDGTSQGWSITAGTGEATVRASHSFASSPRSYTQRLSVDGAAAGEASVECLPSVSAGDVAVLEGAKSSTTEVRVPISLSAPSPVTVTVDVAVDEGTAARSDYSHPWRTTLTFSPGETAKTVSVSVKGDDTREPDESFAVNLSNPVGATLADAQAQVIINNDDPVPTVNITNDDVEEGYWAAFAVELSNPTTEEATVSFATADGTATAPGDYEATSGTLTFTPGATLQWAYVWVYSDGVADAGEYFVVNLAAPTNAVVGTSQARATTTNPAAYSGGGGGGGSGGGGSGGGGEWCPQCGLLPAPRAEGVGRADGVEGGAKEGVQVQRVCISAY